MLIVCKNKIKYIITFYLFIQMSWIILVMDNETWNVI